MIPNQWYAVLETSELPTGRLLGVTRLGEKLVFWRDGNGRVVCQRDKCAHRGAALSEGKLVDGCVECPFHGFRYESSGRARLIPANGRQAPTPERFQVHTYPTAEAHGFIYIWWGEPREALPKPPFFTDIDDSFSYGLARDPWKAHYSRVIENQLDVVHLPFVHHNTIGRGNRTLVSGPVVRWLDDNTFLVYVYNEVDQGQQPRRPEEIGEPYPAFHLEFRFPNLWQNHISESTRVVAAFVPVDA
ncbi:MAG: aromatic ring-hydroxylating dioxygenase subunit alpha, partial [Chloroflexi bacterium]|nr:aromatic ring-hydroxylating dioxygenase subunit alpha [Chloroflexota bacterium]